MNNYNINDENFIKSKIYNDFMKENPAYGYLSIRAYTANQALPISNLKIVISSNISGDSVIFFEGYTNSSGVIEKISLPAPKLNINNLNEPNKTIYKITATSASDNINKVYSVSIYENVSVIQNINIVPNKEMGDM